MKNILKNIFFILFICSATLLYTVNAFASGRDFENIEKQYDAFIQKLETKYNDTKIISMLESISSSLDSLMLKKGITEKKKDIIRFLYNVNRRKMSTFQSGLIKSGVEIQKSKEFKYTIVLKSQMIRRNIPSYIQTLLDKEKQLYNTNSVYEYYDESNQDIKKINFLAFYRIDSQTAQLLKDRNGIIASPKEGEYIFIEQYWIEKKYPFSSFYTDETLTSKFIDLDKKYLQEGDTYYTYIFSRYKVFTDEYGFYDSIFTRDNIIKSHVGFIRDSDGRFGYLDDYKKVKLINKSLISDISDKDKFLSIVADDKKYLSGDTDSDFKNLKRTVSEIASDRDTREEKIKKIYAWMLDNISYSKEFNIEDKQIFSGIDTFGDHEGVCDGYVKLMSYMLLYAGINDIEVLRGDVIDAQDFPYIGHAWLKIGDEYYDPTFDDPVGLTKTLEFSQYKYYKIPHDLIYSNRFDYLDTPESIKKASFQEREELIKRNLSNLILKYTDNKFLLLKPFTFRKKYGFKYNKNIGVEDLKNIIPYVEQINNNEIMRDNKIQKIPKPGYSYYIITDITNLENILQAENYDLSRLVLIKLNSGGYRVSYNLLIK